jgi:hypothetical protein
MTPCTCGRQSLNSQGWPPKGHGVAKLGKGQDTLSKINPIFDAFCDTVLHSVFLFPRTRHRAFGAKTDSNSVEMLSVTDTIKHKRNSSGGRIQGGKSDPKTSTSPESSQGGAMIRQTLNG